jgi:hypothetical protein
MIRALWETLGRHYEEVDDLGNRAFGGVVGGFWATAARFSVGYVDGNFDDG